MWFDWSVPNVHQVNFNLHSFVLISLRNLYNPSFADYAAIRLILSVTMDRSLDDVIQARQNSRPRERRPPRDGIRKVVFVLIFPLLF